jgi:hypothetical protein
VKESIDSHPAQYFFYLFHIFKCSPSMRPVREASLARPPGTDSILRARRAPGELCLKLTELGYYLNPMSIVAT